jgi:hypothetical protein
MRRGGHGHGIYLDDTRKDLDQLGLVLLRRGFVAVDAAGDVVEERGKVGDLD